MFFGKQILRTVKPRHILTMALLFSFFLVRAQTSFDINDPRNPNCPCHKYQKLAEEEYKKMLRAGNKGVGEFAGKTNWREDKIHKVRLDKYRKQKRKKGDRKIRTPKWAYKFKHSGIWKRVTDPGKCPVWNDR